MSISISAKNVADKSTEVVVVVEAPVYRALRKSWAKAMSAAAVLDIIITEPILVPSFEYELVPNENNPVPELAAPDPVVAVSVVSASKSSRVHSKL